MTGAQTPTAAAEAVPGAEAPRRRSVLQLLRRYSVVIILVGLVVGFTIGSDRFLSWSNFSNIALQSSIVAIIAVGMTFTMLTGGIDLSVGSVAALSGAVCAGMIVREGLGVGLSITIALLVGAGAGLVSGLLIVKGRMPPFVATLAMLAIARGLTLLYTDGRPIAGMDESFTRIGTGEVVGIPVPVIVMAVIVAIATWVLRSTRVGHHTYAVGESEEVSRLAGISVSRTVVRVYVISGAMAAIGGVLLTARLFSAQPTAATGTELDAIAAAVLGGVSLFGGVGSALGAVAGAFILGILSNGLNLMGVSSFYQQVIKGIVLVLAVVLDLAAKRRR